MTACGLLTGLVSDGDCELCATGLQTGVEATGQRRTWGSKGRLCDRILTVSVHSFMLDAEQAHREDVLHTRQS